MERARTTCLVGFTGLLIGGFVVAALLLFAWSSTAEHSTTSMNATALPIMPTSLPMPTIIPTAQVRIETAVSGPAVAQGMRVQARLETVEIPITVPVTGTVGAGRFERLFGVQNRDVIVFMAYGVATAGVDLATIKDQDVAVLPDGTIVLTVTTELFHVWMDNQASKIIDRDKNVFARFSQASEQLETEVRKKAELALQEAACIPDMRVMSLSASQVAPGLEKLLNLVAARTAAKQVPIRVVALPGMCSTPFASRNP